MSRSRSAALLVGVLLLVCPAVAGASYTPRNMGPHAANAQRRHGMQRRDEVRLALTIAEGYWGSAPCAGAIAVTAGMRVPAGMAPDTDAWVTFDSSLGADNLGAPAATYTACRIGLARWQWPNAVAIDNDWGMFCLTVIHEVGHLLGYPHSSLPGSVMAPVFTNESSVPRSCR